jgi:hypothetical protein
VSGHIRGVRATGRDVAALMVGDVIYDGAGVGWRLSEIGADTLTLTAASGAVGTGAAGVAGVVTRTAPLPPAGARVGMTQGPGWGAGAGGERALAWAVGLVAEVLGGSEIEISAGGQREHDDERR